MVAPRAMISLLFLSSSNRQLPKQGQLRSIQVVSCKKSTNQFILGGGEAIAGHQLTQLDR